MDFQLDKPRPSVNELLTDLYQITMTYSYFKQGRHNLPAVFDAFFRKAPFKGKFTIFAGLRELVNFIQSFKIKQDQVDYLKQQFPHWTEDFYEYLKSLDGSLIKIYAIKEGSLVFPKEPLIQLEGPIGFLQLIETTILNLLNFPTLMATNARRMKIASEPNMKLIEFGLRRAQGPDGAMMATQYSYLGGFHGTSNVAGGKAYGIPIYGTMAHAYVSSFQSLNEIHTIDGKDIKELAVQIRKKMQCEHTNEGELASFIAYACDHPNGFLALVDTYDTLYSGVPNFLAVAIALKKVGREPRGIRLDSGDLSQLSKDAKKFITENAKKFDVSFEKLEIFASNDLNEPTLLELKAKGHSITSYGIGTNLVTCQAQPALGMVYKLVELHGEQTIKFSEEIEKITIPGKKRVYRLYTKKDGFPTLDVIAAPDEEIQEGHEIFLRDLSDRTARFIMKPERVEALTELVWDGKLVGNLPNLIEARSYCEKQIENFDPMVLSLTKPTSYKVFLTQKLCKATEKVIDERSIWKEIKGTNPNV